MRSILISFTLCAIILCPAYGQKIKVDKVIDSAAVWSKGEIVLANAKKLSGLVRYNKMTGLLQFENELDSKSLTPASVLSFTFYDSLHQKQRKFISYGFESMKLLMDSIARARGITPVKVNPKFFEVLMEFNSFAVLCMTGPLTVTTSNGSIGSFSIMTGIFNVANAKQPSTTYSYSEQLYIFDKDGKVMPLLIIFNRKKDGLLFDMNHSSRFGKFADIIIQRYTEPYFYQIDDYAYENKLSYEKKEDILKMFEYYRTLITN